MNREDSTEKKTRRSGFWKDLELALVFAIGFGLMLLGIAIVGESNSNPAIEGVLWPLVGSLVMALGAGSILLYHHREMVA